MREMHFLVVTSFLVAFLMCGGWRKSKKYHATMLYVIVVNFFYLIICHDYPMWKYAMIDDRYELIVEILYSVVVLPSTVFLFFEFFPKKEKIKTKLLYMFKWQFIFVFAEWLMWQFESIKYFNNWSIYWSSLFLTFMFPCIYIHNFKPVLTYLISIIFIIFLILIFDVSIFVPLLER